jgi:hypothetical protein
LLPSGFDARLYRANPSLCRLIVVRERNEAVTGSVTEVAASAVRVPPTSSTSPMLTEPIHRATTLVEEIEDEALKEGFLSAPRLRCVLEASARAP